MRVLLIFTCFLSSLASLAQVPNFEFEEWNSRDFLSPNHWILTGNASVTADAHSGTSAIKLENKNGNFGYFANTLISQEITGESYEDFPLTARFSLKYDIAAGDTGKVLGFFMSAGNPVGTINFNVVGNSGDTFTTFNYPIYWQVNLTPDTFIFVVTSKDFEDPVINGDGYLIFDNLSLETFGTPDQQAINPDFELNDTSRVPYPEHWYTSDLIGVDLYGAQEPINSVVQTTESHHGIGLKLSNVMVGNDLFPGFASTGTSFDLSFPPTFSVSKRWAHLQGYYKYENDGLDEAKVYAIMYYQGSAMGVAEFIIDESQSELTYFSTPITYYVPTVAPDSAVIIITCSDFENPLSENTSLWIDKVTFANTPASVSESSLNVTIYPNPVMDQLFVDVTGPVEITITDLFGKELGRYENSTIDVTHLSPGNYILRVRANDNISHSKFIKL